MRLPEIFQGRAWHVLIGAPLLIGVLAIGGCSSRFFYNHLDSLATWYFEDLVSLNDGQRTELRSWLERTLSWHRQSELTRYSAFVSDVATSFAQPGDRDTYESIRQRFQGLVDDLLKKTAPEASQLLLRLSPAQIDEMLANLAEKTRENTEENAEEIADGEWRPNQAKTLTRQLKRWTGSVTSQQKQLIASGVERLEPTYEEWADSQRAWRESLRSALAQSAQTEGAPPARVLEVLEDPDRHWTATYAQKVARNRERYEQLLFELDASLSSQQRAHLRAELTKLSQHLARLASS